MYVYILLDIKSIAVISPMHYKKICILFLFVQRRYRCFAISKFS